MPTWKNVNSLLNQRRILDRVIQTAARQTTLSRRQIAHENLELAKGFEPPTL